jgi:ATP-dependent RNA helicase SUPV3L1/SUV3
VAAQRAALSGRDRKALARLGVRLGTETVYFDAILKRDAACFAAMLWAVRNASAVPVLPGGVAARRDPEVTEAAYAAIGYRVLGARLLRVDKVERLAAEARRLARQGPFGPSPELAALAGSSLHDLAAMLTSLAYRAVHDGNGVTFHARREARRRSATGRTPSGDGPFAKLAALRLAQ